MQIFSLGFSSASDGNNEIGFPFTFYEYLGGKRFPEPDTRHHFIILAFLVDIVISLLFPLAFLWLWKRSKLKKAA